MSKTKIKAQITLQREKKIVYDGANVSSQELFVI